MNMHYPAYPVVRSNLIFILLWDKRRTFCGRIFCATLIEGSLLTVEVDNNLHRKQGRGYDS